MSRCQCRRAKREKLVPTSTAGLPATSPLIAESSKRLKSITRQSRRTGRDSAGRTSAVGPLSPASASFGCPPGCLSIPVKPFQRLACRAQQRDVHGKRKLKNVAPTYPPSVPGRFLRGAPGIGAWGMHCTFSYFRRLNGKFIPVPYQKAHRSEEHTSELQSLMRISYAVFCLKKKKTQQKHTYKHIRDVINNHIRSILIESLLYY